MTEKKEDTSFAVKGAEALFEEALAAVDKSSEATKAEASEGGDDLNIVWDDDPTADEEVDLSGEVSGDDALGAAPATPVPATEASQGAVLALEKELQVAQEALEEKTSEAKTNYEKFVRVTAEFDNFRKRTQREKEELRRFGHKPMMVDLLDVLDNFGRALETLENADASIREGIEMVHRQFLDIFSRHGAKPFQSLNEPFDYNLHQAISTAETTEQPPEHIHSVFKEGYMLHDQLLRPAMVVVAKAPAEPQPAADEAAGDAESAASESAGDDTAALGDDAPTNDDSAATESAEATESKA